MMAVGFVASGVLIAGPLRVGDITLDIHALLIAGCLCIVGYQLLLFAVITKTFVVREGLHPPSVRLDRLYRFVNLEVGLFAGAATFVAGVALLISVLLIWRHGDFSSLDPRVTMRLTIPAVVLIVLGV